MKHLAALSALVLCLDGATAADPPKKALPLPGEVFALNGRTAFLIPATADPHAAAKPWVWYAPTLPNLPGPEEAWMFERFWSAGVAVAGVDAGESYGSPKGNAVFDTLHAEMTRRGYSARPVLLGRSRGGRHANVRTMRAAMVRADGTGRTFVGEGLATEADTWTQFAGWSPDGKTAVVGVGWQSPENAKWEEENKTFRMEDGRWKYDTCLVNPATGKATNVTAVDRVSHYNSGLFFLPGGKGLGFTALVNGVSKPHVMDADGKNKRDVSGGGGGFAYGYSASPDGKHFSYHENYQLHVSAADGTGKWHIMTGNTFDFALSWSPDGKWLLFLSGEHYDCHPHVVRPDGTGLKKPADRGGYRGVVEFLDVPDFHGGSSDVPVWAADGSAVYFTAKAGKSVDLFRVTLDGSVTPLTKSPDDTLHYHPQPSPDGNWMVYGSKRGGVRNLYVMNLTDRTERRVTDQKAGTAAKWSHWQPPAAK